MRSPGRKSLTQPLASAARSTLALDEGKLTVSSETLIERDEAMYWYVIDIVHPIVKAEADTKRIVQANKLDNAYDIVAADWGVSRSTVVKACGRVLERARETAVFLGRPPKKMNEYFRRKAYPSGSGSARMW